MKRAPFMLLKLLLIGVWSLVLLPSMKRPLMVDSSAVIILLSAA